MIYINNSTEWVEIPKTYPQNIYKYGLRFVNQTTHKVIALIAEDNSQVETLYKFNIRNVIDKFEVGQYDYTIMSPDWSQTYTSGVLQYGEYKAQVIGYSPTINIIQYNPYIAPAPQPKREIDIVENGTYDVENYEIANVNVKCEEKPEETGSAEYTENGEYTINPNEGYVFSSVNVKVNTPEPKEEQTKSVNIDKNGDSVVTPDNGKVLTSVNISVNVPSDKKPEETFNETYTDNGTYDIEPTTGSVFSSGTVVVNVPKQKTEETFNETYTDNGTFNINPASGNVFSGGVVNVNVPKQKEEQEKTVNIVENGTTSVMPDSGKVLSKVDVNVNVPKPTLEELNVTENGVYTPTEYGYSKVTVDVAGQDFKLPNGTKFTSSTFSSITLGDTTSEITDFNNFLGGIPIANNLTTVGEMNTSKGTDFKEMFQYCTKLTSVSGNFDLSNATTTDGMFYRCDILKDYPKFTISDKLTNTRRMFMQNYALTTMPIKTSELANVTDTELMYGLTGITDSLYEVRLPKATQIRAMFGKTKVRKLSIVYAPLATASDFMFQNCEELTMVPSLMLPLVENAESMFEGCTKLGSVQLAGQTYDLSSLRKADNMFKGCDLHSFPSTFPNVSLTSAVSMFEGIQSDISNYNSGVISVSDKGDIDFSNIFKDSKVTKFNIGFPYTHGVNVNLTSAYENTNIIEINSTFSYVDNQQEESNFAKINANRMFYNCKSLTTSEFGGISLNDTRENYTNYYHGISNANSMYYNCSNLSHISQAQKDYLVLYMGYCEDVTDMFYNCTSLELGEICFLKDVGKGFTSYNKDFDLSYMTGYLATSELKYFVDAFYDLNLNPQTSATVYFNNEVRNQINQYTVSEYDNKTISAILQERGWQIQYQSH